MWDKRYKENGFAYGMEPNDFLKDSIKHIKPQGKVLCIGEGEGRNALFLKKEGFEVAAVDLSPIGREKALKLFKESGYELDYNVANLAEFDFGFEKWDAIVSVFCHLPEEKRQDLHKKIEHSLTAGGAFLLEGFSKGQLKNNTGGPRKLGMLFSEQEFEKDFCELNIKLNQEVDREIHEGAYHNGLSTVVQFVGIKGADNE